MPEVIKNKSFARVCPKYSPERDLYEVAQFGFVNLREAYLTHTIPSSIDGVDVNYNDIGSPDKILGKPKDVFEAYRMKDAIAARDAAIKDKASASSEGVATE